MSKGSHYRRRKSRGRVLVWSLLCLLAIGAVLYAARDQLLPEPGPAAPASSAAVSSEEASSLPAASSAAPSLPESEPEPEPVVTTLRIAAAGDNLIHDGLYLQAQRRAQASGAEGYDFAALYQHVAPFFSGFDFCVVNQETLLSDELAPSSYPRFCTPGDMGRHLYSLGFRVFFLANNHIYDQNAEGIASTRRFWASMPEDAVAAGLYAGEEDYSSFPIQQVNGVSIAWLAYTEHTNGLPTPQGAEANVIYTSQEDVIQQQIAQAKEQADLVAVSVHWGTENTHQVNDSQRQLAQKLADWGADIVIGTHPHVVQPIEMLTGAEGQQVPVAYSLGNFASAQDRIDNLIGIALTFTVTKTEQPGGESRTEISGLQAVPLVMHYDAYYRDMRLYLFRDYTDELAASHGVGGVTRAYIQSVLEESIGEEYLLLDPA